MPDAPRGRSPYRSSDAVLAEAQRIAADIRRRAEREANTIRREAAEWASATRQEAERYRRRALAELEHAQAVTEAEVESDPEPTEVPDAEEVVEVLADGAPPPVIDLRPPVATRPVRLVVVPPSDHDDPDGVGEAEETADDEPDEAEVHHRPAVGGTYVVGHRAPAPGTSIETKVHDVVRLAVRRTFNRRFP